MQRLKLRKINCFNTINKTTVRRACVHSATIENKSVSQDLKSYKEIPGPSSLPLAGALFNFLPGGKLAGYKGVKLSERLYTLYGPIVRVRGSFGGSDLVFLFDPEAIEQVHRSEDMKSVRPGTPTLEYYRKKHSKTYDPEQNTGLATEQGEKWRELRMKVNPIMLQPKTVKLYADVLEEVSNDMVARLKSIRDENNKIATDLFNTARLWALESLGTVAFGTRLYCFNPDLPEHSPTKKLINNTAEMFNVVDKLDISPSFWRIFPTPMFKKAMSIYEEHDRISRYFIDLALKRYEESKQNPDMISSEKSIVVKLLEMDPHIAKIMASDLLIGGTETSSSTLISTLYLLAINPEKQKKLREEVLSKQGDKSYMKAVLKESMRVMPATNANLRMTTKEYNLLGYHVPKGVVAAFSHQYMSIMDKHYPKPHEFIPERWLAAKDDPLYRGNTHPMVMAPFGVGSRMCIARRIAELQLETVISNIVKNFEMSWNSDEPIKINHTVFNFYEEPYHFVFKDL